MRGETVALCASLPRRMSDWDKDNALSEQEFCVAMKLVLMRRRGHAIPASLPDPLRPQSQEG